MSPVINFWHFSLFYSFNKSIIMSGYNPSRPYLKNLDELPLPAYHLLPMAKYGPMENFLGENYQGPTRPFSIIVTSRGCPAQCIYCFKRMYQEDQPYRKRSAENVLAEIELLIKKFKIKVISNHFGFFS